MRFIKKIKKFLFDEKTRFFYLSKCGFYRTMDDARYLEKIYKYKFGKDLSLENPKTFNEKLQWLKLHDRKPEYTSMVDKYEAKKYVSSIIGEEYIIPSLGIWDKFDDIDFDALPDQFVLKCTHDSGGLVVCRDKSKLHIKKAKSKINSSMKKNFFWVGREWPYKNVKPMIIAEKYMEDSSTAELRDYKFFCFDGNPEALFVATDRQKEGEEVKFDFFDMDYNHLNLRNGHKNSDSIPQKPQQFELMKDLARKLSQGIPHIRIDFYEVDGKVYFGEMTFFHFSGLVPFEPNEWDYKFGELIKLPPQTN